VRIIANAANGPSPSSSFTSYAFASKSNRLRLTGCAVDEQNMLWDFWSVWAMPEKGWILPVNVRDPTVLEDAPATSHAVLFADCLHCSAEYGCYEPNEAVFNTDPAPGATTDTHNPAIGIIEEFDLFNGRFKAYATVARNIGKVSRIHVDISWPPSALTFPAGNIDDHGGITP
jgi:hypothetical protein